MRQDRVVTNPYASLADRVRASLVDGAVWIVWFLLVPFLPWPDGIPGQGRLAFWILPPLIAEPIEVHLRRASIGQALLGLRVEARPGRAFPGLPRLYLRHFSKFFLGGLSFAYIPFAPRNEAMHDRLAGIVVVKGTRPQPIDPIRPEAGSMRRMFAMAVWLILGSIFGSFALGLVAAIVVPGYLEAEPGEMRHVEAGLTILLGCLESWILYRGVNGRLPGLRISPPPTP
jgi:uncharacterized RDD family membrane protein YckC